MIVGVPGRLGLPAPVASSRIVRPLASDHARIHRLGSIFLAVIAKATAPKAGNAILIIATICLGVVTVILIILLRARCCYNGQRAKPVDDDELYREIRWGPSPGSVVESVVTGVGPVDNAVDERNPRMVISSGASVA